MNDAYFAEVTQYVAYPVRGYFDKGVATATVGVISPTEAKALNARAQDAISRRIDEGHPPVSLELIREVESRRNDEEHNARAARAVEFARRRRVENIRKHPLMGPLADVLSISEQLRGELQQNMQSVLGELMATPPYPEYKRDMYWATCRMKEKLPAAKILARWNALPGTQRQLLCPAAPGPVESDEPDSLVLEAMRNFKRAFMRSMEQGILGDVSL